MPVSSHPCTQRAYGFSCLVGLRLASLALIGALAAVLSLASVSGARADEVDPKLALTKTVDKDTYSAVGEVFTYTYIITNIGNITLGRIQLTDDRVTNIQCTWPGIAGVLNVDQTSTCTGTYKITQADIDAGSVTNTATVTGFIDVTQGPLSRTFAAADTGIRERSLLGTILHHLNPISTAHAQAAPSATATAMVTIRYVAPEEEETETRFDPRPQTNAVAKRFMGHRMRALLNDEPDRPRFVRRYPGSLWGKDGTNVSPFNMSTSETGGLTFSGSLNQLAGSLGNPSLNNGFDIWTEGRFTSFDDEGGADGDVDVLYVGADYAINPNWIIGVLGQFDWAEESTQADGSKASGEGWMVGPYVSGQIAENLFFDWRAAWGASDNSISPFGTYVDHFDTDRWLTTARLTGNWTSGAWRMTPSVTVKYGEENQQGYTDSNGFRISGQSVNLGLIEFGPEVAYRWELGDGTIIEPQLSLVGVWNYQDGGYFSINGQSVNPGDFTARLEGGLGVEMPNGLSARGAVAYDGMGTEYDAVTGKVWLNLPLN